MPKRSRKSGSLAEGHAPESLWALAEEYLSWLLVRHYSATTVDTRRPCLRYFLEWASERGVEMPGELSRALVERYQRWLFYYRKANGHPLTVHTQGQRLIALQSFCQWLARQRHVLCNPATELEIPKRGQRLPRMVLTASEAEAVLNAVDAGTPFGLRDRAILETFYSTGIRRGELSKLRLYDLDHERRTLMVREGKGQRDRLIPIGERALWWVEKYLREARPRLARNPDEGWLFLTYRGDPMGREVLTILVRERIQKADIGKTGSCHLWRHTMATLMLENGADIRFIQQMLGHVKLETTQVYTQVALNKLQEIHAATHPAKLRKPVERPGQDAEAGV
jgi:integrase/recombinase XerD